MLTAVIGNDTGLGCGIVVEFFGTTNVLSYFFEFRGDYEWHVFCVEFVFVVVWCY